MKKTITYFMWGYQPHFNHSLKQNSKTILESIGVDDIELETFLVGIRSSELSSERFPICIEPEDGKWELSLFDSFSIELETDNHPLKDIFYSNDEKSMREKPEKIHREAISNTVKKLLSVYDQSNNVKSFVGLSALVEGYYVVPVIQIPQKILSKYPLLNTRKFKNDDLFHLHLNFIEATLSQILSRATQHLNADNSGRGLWRSDEKEVAKNAAYNFMYTPSLAIEKGYPDINFFETFNLISSLFYEGVHSIGKVILADPQHPSIIFLLQFKYPIPISNSRWVRKVLEMSSDNLSLIIDDEYIYGLGQLCEDYNFADQKIFTVNFLDHYYWQITCGDIVLLQSKYNQPKLPTAPIKDELVLSNLRRLYPYTTEEEQKNILNLIHSLTTFNHGSMLVIAEDAEAEANRLSTLGTPIFPILMTPELLKQVSGIDGTVIIDPKGYCFGIGIILDGEANVKCTPSRGSRYNSGVRYVYSSQEHKRLAIIYSEDKTIDIVPKLRPLMSNTLIESNITKLEAATLENYHKPRKWIDDNRFYFDADQCLRVNAALDRLESSELSEGQFIVQTMRLMPSIEMDKSYLIE
ncbi:hypothetical protein E0H86_04080 [Acinetobacter sp. ANC 4635]|uniref:hypothetical protein n=1 Tax=Acinetobacter sp. ANC 4635 TaxID=2529846 RepID=UPI00103EFDCE|nr:hypothetical protein [Acinetobacter sp. ANC 4635]TCB32644.1 hypothetical protein E0H86_04080 [Acinetobacter sp. ANC 4635]